MYNVYRGYLTDRGVFNARMHYHVCFANFSFFNIFTLMFLFLFSFHSNRLSKLQQLVLSLYQFQCAHLQATFIILVLIHVYTAYTHTHTHARYTHTNMYTNACLMRATEFFEINIFIRTVMKKIIRSAISPTSSTRLLHFA